MLPLLPLLIIAASTVAKAKANHDAQKRQDQLRKSMETYQLGKAREGEAATERLITKQTPAARDTELATETADRERSLRDTVGAAQAFDAAPIAGKLSSDYKAAQEKESSTVAERTRRAIEQLATMSAPGEQERAFGIRFGRAAGEVDSANIASSNVGRAYVGDINNVRPNAGLSLIGDLGMAVGGGMLGGGAGAAASVNNGQGYEDASGNLYSNNVTRQQRMNRGFSLWGSQR